MSLLNLTEHQEHRIISFGIISFWWFFWLLNIIDKIIPQNTFLWVGKDRLAQFINYFDTIGITNSAIPLISLIVITILQILAFTFLTLAYLYFFQHRRAKTRTSLFYGILISLAIFSVFSIADQVFGDRVELLEHSLYWLSLVISWFIFTHHDIPHR